MKEIPWTKTPNSLLDCWLPKLKDTELRVLLVLVRATYGWNRGGASVSITYRELKARTGRESEAISQALRSLSVRGLIHIPQSPTVRVANAGGRETEPQQ